MLIKTPHQRHAKDAPEAMPAAYKAQAAPDNGAVLASGWTTGQMRPVVGEPAEVAGPLRVAFAGSYFDPAAPSIIRKAAAKASRFLARNVRTKSIPMRNTQPLITFTFDDVPASSCRDGAKILERHDARGTYFIAGAGCGRMSPSGALATIDQIKALAATGHEIGCHTYTHPAVTAISLRDLEHEVQRNREFLGECGGVIPRNFAFPYGDLSFRTKRFLERRFDSCRSDRRGVNTGALDLGALKSLPLENASINRAKIMMLIEAIKRSNGWLIFSGHAVETDPTKFGVTPELLSFTVAAAKSHGCRTVTIAEGLRLAKG